MPRITFILADGSKTEVDAAEGELILDIAHENGIDIEGACDGSMACSTCHVIVDESWCGRLPPPSEEEEYMLDLAIGVTPTSRLGCQIQLTAELDGLILRLPAETRNALL